jgi:hypothetical protein
MIPLTHRQAALRLARCTLLDALLSIIVQFAFKNRRHPPTPLQDARLERYAREVLTICGSLPR